MPCVYVLYSESTNKHYTGSTRDKNGITRLKSHNSGKTRSIKSGMPWKIIMEENFPDYTSARKREIFLKSGQGRKYIKERCESGLIGRS